MAVLLSVVATPALRAAPRCQAALVASWISSPLGLLAGVGLMSMTHPTFSELYPMGTFGDIPAVQLVAAPAGWARSELPATSTATLSAPTIDRRPFIGSPLGPCALRHT